MLMIVATIRQRVIIMGARFTKIKIIEKIGFPLGKTHHYRYADRFSVTKLLYFHAKMLENKQRISLHIHILYVFVFIEFEFEKQWKCKTF